MEIITLIFEALTTIAGEVINWFTSLFSGVAGVFYTAGTEGEPASLTLLGVLSLIGVAVGAFYFVLRWLMNLIQIRTRG